jgi:putative phosphoribosyl transferase
MVMFRDRADAGRKLADRLGAMPSRHLPRSSLVVLGLPRGGVPVAFEIATALRAPLDVIIVRKLGVPSHPELAMGAIGEGDVRIVNDEVMRRAGVDASAFAAIEQRERHELARRAARFRGNNERVPLAGHTALVVDDGIATGSTAQAACRVARAQGAEHVILAAPVAPPSVVENVRGAADEVIVLRTPEPFFAIGQFYDDFTQTSDDEVMRLLARSRTEDPADS